MTWKSRLHNNLFIAALDAPAKERALADYVCDGVNDEVQALAAIAALPATGGAIEFSSGTFVRGAADIAITKGNIELFGQGRSTIWMMKSATNASGQIFSATSIDGISIKEMIIDGNEALNTSGSQYGINFTGCTNLDIDCWIENFRTGDLIVNNIETCGKINNRNYDDAYTPRFKKLLDVDGTGWTTVSGSPTITEDTETLVGTTCLRVVAASEATIVIEHALVADIRHYPIIQFLIKRGTPGVRLPSPQADFVITLIDSAGSEVSTNVVLYDRFNTLDANNAPTYSTDNNLDGWHRAELLASDFGWDNNYHILGDVAKIRISLKGKWGTGADLKICQINAIRGLPRPVATFAFDDAKVTQHDVVLPLLKSYGWAGVVAVNSHRMGLLANDTTWAESSVNPSSDVMTWAQLADFRPAGWDVVSHTASHARSTSDMSGVDGVNVGYESRQMWEMAACIAALSSYGHFRGIEYFSHSGSSIDEYESIYRKFFKAGRCLAEGFNLPYDRNPCALFFVPMTTTNVAHMLKWHVWGISVIHDVGPTYTPSTIELTALMDDVKAAGIEVLTYSDMFTRYPIMASSPYVHPEYKTYSDTFTDLIAADADYIHAGIAGTGAAQTITTFAHQPDYPRNITISCTNVASPSGAVTIYGTDARGYLISQKVTIVPGGLVTLTGAFATVTSVVIPATVAADDTITVGIGDWLGLSHWILAYTDVLSITRNGTPVTVEADLFIVKGGFVSWEATVDLGTISDGDDVVIRYRTNM